MLNIIGFGNALVDALLRIDSDDLLDELGLYKGGMRLIDEAQFDALWQRLRGRTMERHTGGSGGNCILCFADLGGDAAFVGKTADDDNGHFYAAERREQGVRDIRLTPTGSGRTGVATTFITPDGQRTFATHLGVAGQLSVADLQPLSWRGYDICFLEGYLVQDHDLVRAAIRKAHDEGLRVFLDLASYNIVEEHLDFFREILPEVDTVFANEEEAHALTGLSPEAALEVIAAYCRVAVVKVGCHGAMARTAGHTYRVPAYPVGSVIDTTAAGDFFAGGYAYAFARGLSVEACLTLGARCAAEVIQVVGTRLSDAVWDDLRRFANDLH